MSALAESEVQSDLSIQNRFHTLLDTTSLLEEAHIVPHLYYDGVLQQERKYVHPATSHKQHKIYTIRQTAEFYSGYFLPDTKRHHARETVLFLGYHHDEGKAVFELRRVPFARQPEAPSTHRSRRLFGMAATEENQQLLQNAYLARSIQDHLMQLMQGKRRTGGNTLRIR